MILDHECALVSPWCHYSGHARRVAPGFLLDVEPQQVVLQEAEAADGCFAFETAVGSMPVVGMGPRLKARWLEVG